MDSLKKIFKNLKTYDLRIFETIYNYQANNYNLYYDTFDNFFSKKVMPIWRRILYYMCLLIHTLYAIKYSILTLNDEPWVQVMLGDVTFLFVSQYAKVNSLWFCGTLILLFSKLVICYYEHSVDNSSIKIIHTLTKKSSFFRLNKSNENKLILRANIFYWFLIRLLTPIGIFFVTIFYIVLALVGYLFADYPLTMANFYVFVISDIFMAISLKIILTLNLGLIIFLYILLDFLMMKIDEIIKSIRVNKRWRNKVGLLNNIDQYDHFIKFLNVTSRPINMVRSLVQLMIPYMSSQIWHIIRWKTNDLSEKILKLVFIFVILGSSVYMIILNYYLALLARMNRSIHKCFYLVIFNKAFKRRYMSDLLINLGMKYLKNIKFVMKVDSFIARVNKQNTSFPLVNVMSLTIKFLKMNIR